jgi:hypothetical protein
MILTCLLLALGWPAMQSPPVQQTGKSLDVEAAKSDPGIGAKLLHVQRIYVETFWRRHQFKTPARHDR